jgi:hypothetical protein
MRSSLVALSALSWLCFVGCGASKTKGPELLVPVTGTVKVGGQPGKGVVVTLAPIGQTKGIGGFAVADETGAFTVMHRGDAEGVEPGEYAVQFNRYVLPDGSALPPNTSPHEANARESIAAPWSGGAPPIDKQKVIVAKDGSVPLTFDVPAAKLAKR